MDTITKARIQDHRSRQSRRREWAAILRTVKV